MEGYEGVYPKACPIQKTPSKGVGVPLVRGTRNSTMLITGLVPENNRPNKMRLGNCRPSADDNCRKQNKDAGKRKHSKKEPLSLGVASPKEVIPY